MLRSILRALAIVLFFSATAVYPAKIEVFTADNIIQLIKSKIGQIKTFTGSFVYAVNNKSYWGVIKFKSPNKFVMTYMANNSTGTAVESGQKFVSDGKNLWLVFKDQNIAINETLEKDRSNPMFGWNINRIQKEYVPTLPKTGYKVKYGNIEAYKITFVPKSNTSGFKFINMVIDENGSIMKIESQNQVGNNIELGLKYDGFNQPIAEENFEYEPDENTQIYENILLPKGQNDSSDEQP
jgi:outer membrane lipoprotein-sorting protein